MSIGLEFVLLNISVCDASSVRMIYLDQSGQLWVSHFGKCDSEGYSVFCIVEESARFSFGGGQHHIAHGFTNGMYCVIRSGSGNGRLGGIIIAGGECEEATDSAAQLMF